MSSDLRVTLAPTYDQYSVMNAQLRTSQYSTWSIYSTGTREAIFVSGEYVACAAGRVAAWQGAKHTAWATLYGPG